MIYKTGLNTFLLFGPNMNDLRDNIMAGDEAVQVE